MTEEKKKSLVQAVKFTLFSASAGIIQFGSFALMEFLVGIYWIDNAVSIILSVLWNFTLNRKYTFRSATNVPIAMLKVAGFYLVFTPLSSWLGDRAVAMGAYSALVFVITILINFVLEFLFCKFVVYRGQEDTLQQ